MCSADTRVKPVVRECTSSKHELKADAWPIFIKRIKLHLHTCNVFKNDPNIMNTNKITINRQDLFKNR